MGKDSRYYADLKKNKLSKINEIKIELPSYTYQFIDSCILKYQINTALAYSKDLMLFFDFLYHRNPQCHELQIKNIPLEILGALNAEDINEFQKYMVMNDGGSGHMVSNRTLARKMAVLRNFFGYMTDKRFISEDPTIKAEKNRRFVENDIKRLDVDEAHRLIKAVEETRSITKRSAARSKNTAKRDLAIVILLLNLGIRVSECAGLDLNDVNFEDNTVRIVRKGGKEAILYINEVIRNTLKDYIKNERPLLTSDPKEEALFISLKNNRLSVRSIEDMLKKYGEGAKLTERVHPHKLRRTFGTRLYNSSGDIYMVADVLGHKDVNTTVKHYAAVDEEHRRSMANYDLFASEQQ
ncbi:MAG: tyrosine-type recombinase/integrase [Clostridium sp.]|nr:tyrosine-type recombinase/integrase [Clostridium sp.]